jgi:hypothetical protein
VKDVDDLDIIILVVLASTMSMVLATMILLLCNSCEGRTREKRFSVGGSQVYAHRCLCSSAMYRTTSLKLCHVYSVQVGVCPCILSTR